MAKHLFPAANTPVGFYSCFHNVLSRETANKIIYIKGGSGSGKSTLMQKLGQAAEDCGLTVEYCHCSSDPDSLDGIHIVERKTAIFDGTAPHTMDPSYPGMTDELFNLADFWDDRVLIPHRAEMAALSAQKKNCFDNAYRYFAAAKVLSLENEAVDDIAIKSACGLITPHFESHSRKLGHTRKLFASGLTPKGAVNFLDTILEGRTIGVIGKTDASLLLQEINRCANLSGFNTDAFFCPFSPDSKLEHLVIKEAGLSFTTLNKYHTAATVDETIYLSDPEQKDKKLFDSLIKKGIAALKEAKKYHGKIEGFYIPAMDFDALNLKLPVLKEKLFIYED